jgi:hypothetical protein
MLSAVTPRVEVLAVLTEDGDTTEVPLVDGLPAVDVVDEAEAPHPAVPTRTAPTTAMVPINEERRCRPP